MLQFKLLPRDPISQASMINLVSTETQGLEHVFFCGETVCHHFFVVEVTLPYERLLRSVSVV
jgi:hypothetical protein